MTSVKSLIMEFSKANLPKRLGVHLSSNENRDVLIVEEENGMSRKNGAKHARHGWEEGYLEQFIPSIVNVLVKM